jgi:hypothetical protein
MCSSSEDRYELIIGLVAPVGVDISSVNDQLKDYITQCGYDFNKIRLSDFIRTVSGLETQIRDGTEYERIDSLMTAGNEVRNMTCPPKISPVLMLDWRLRKGGYFIGQKTIQTRANHQQAP